MDSENMNGAVSPEAALEALSQDVDNAVLHSIRTRKTWYFAYDLMLDQTVASRYVRGLKPGKVVRLPNHKLSFPYFYPPEGTSLASVARTNDDSDEVWGYLYEANEVDFKRLERHLKVPNRYFRKSLHVMDRGGRIMPAFTYTLVLADDEPQKPSEEYISQLAAAAKERGLPDKYIASLGGGGDSSNGNMRPAI